VHTVDFEGKYYKSRGPLNTVRPPQGHPVLCQAGASPPGARLPRASRTRSSRTANTPERAKAFRDDIRARLVEGGRKPDDCKILFLIAPIVADTVAEAQAKKLRWMSDPQFIELVLTTMVRSPRSTSRSSTWTHRFRRSPPTASVASSTHSPNAPKARLCGRR